jgi:hypothetical protein
MNTPSADYLTIKGEKIMIKILESHSEGIRNGKNYIRADIMIDSAAELTVEGFQNYHFTMGSIAWVIPTGDFYALDSQGNWHKQSGSGSSVEEGE